MRLLQINSNCSRASVDVTLEVVNRIDVDIIVMSEPHKKSMADNRWHATEDKDAAICLLATGYAERSRGRGRGFVWADYRIVTVCSCYISPNITINEFGYIVDELAEDIRAKGRGNFIVCGDFNAKATEWGCENTDARGYILLEALATFELVAVNGGNETRSRGLGKKAPFWT